MILLPVIPARVETAANSPTLYVSLAVQNQPFSWLGFYDTLFPLNITINVYNEWTEKFPGGNLTGELQAPTKWGISGLIYQIPSLDPGKSASYSLPLKPQEAGVYTFLLNRLDVRSSPGSAPPYWQVSGGFVAVQIDPPSTLFMVLIIIVLTFILAVLCLGTLLLWRRTGSHVADTRQTKLPISLLNAFNMFDAGKKMEGYLLHDKDPNRFEAAVAWMLQILGFEALRLDKGAQGENFSEGKTVVGSADILAYDPSFDRLLVVDCTVGLPNVDTAQRVLNLADRLRAQLGKCDAVVISAENADLQKKARELRGLIVIDHNDLEEIMTFVKSDRFDKAKRAFD